MRIYNPYLMLTAMPMYQPISIEPPNFINGKKLPKKKRFGGKRR
jgi:hypothetical protein